MSALYWEATLLPAGLTWYGGIKAIAIIRPEHYFNKVAVEIISYKVDKDKLSISFFENIEDAMEWLNNI